ncbi:MAG: 30S ribosomal protein S21 [Anaerolineales bacterium]
MVKVISKPGESDAQLFRRFKRKVSRSGILRTVRKKRWFVPKSEIRRIEKKKAIRRHRRKQRTRHHKTR